MTRDERFHEAAVRIANGIGSVFTRVEKWTFRNPANGTMEREDDAWLVCVGASEVFRGRDASDALTKLRAWVAEHGRRAA